MRRRPRGASPGCLFGRMISGMNGSSGKHTISVSDAAWAAAGASGNASAFIERAVLAEANRLARAEAGRITKVMSGDDLEDWLEWSVAAVRTGAAAAPVRAELEPGQVFRRDGRPDALVVVLSGAEDNADTGQVTVCAYVPVERCGDLSEVIRLRSSAPAPGYVVWTLRQVVPATVLNDLAGAVDPGPLAAARAALEGQFRD